MGFFKLFKKTKRHLETAANMKFDELADPKVQLEQAMQEGREQARKLHASAASVLASQKTAEMRLNRTIAELDKVRNSAAQALRMADEETDSTKKDQFNRAAEGYAHRLIALQGEAESGKAQVEAATVAAEQAKKAVSDNNSALTKRIAEQHKLLSQLDQAKMQEAMNATLDNINAISNESVPTLDQVREKIEARYAKAIGVSTLAQSDTSNAEMMVEHAQIDAEAQAALSELRTQLGIGPGSASPAPSTQNA